MEQISGTVQELLSYMNDGVTPFHVVSRTEEMLQEAGFCKLEFGREWKLEKGGRYYTVPYGTCLFAFVVGDNFAEGNPIHMIGAHTDSPCLRVKPSPEIEGNGYRQLNVEVYGGAILNTWLDRPLSIAGKVMLRGQDAFHPYGRLYRHVGPVLLIPNLAIHMNRDVNKGTELNKQTQMLPIFGLSGEETDHEFFLHFLAEQMNCQKEDILDYDLYLSLSERGCIWGQNREFISSPRLDNLTSCFAAVKGIAGAISPERLSVIALYDNEEIGSRTKQGADSVLTDHLLHKIYEGLGYRQLRLIDSMQDSMMLSFDVAHAFHPNYSGKYDPNLHVIPGKGPAVKISYNQKYATDTQAIAIITGLLQEKGIPFQRFVNRSDQVGGSTLGAITQAYLPMKTVDIGVGILAMHSASEMMAAEDQVSLNCLTEAFFS